MLRLRTAANEKTHFPSTCIYIYIHTHLSLSLSLSLYICACGRRHTHIHIRTYLCMYIQTHMKNLRRTKQINQCSSHPGPLWRRCTSISSAQQAAAAIEGMLQAKALQKCSAQAPAMKELAARSNSYIAELTSSTFVSEILACFTGAEARRRRRWCACQRSSQVLR